jgi:isoleucyl-tRNA synthetase
MVWVVPDQSTETELAPFLQIMADELNVKSVKLRHDDQNLVTRSATANFKTLGKRVGSRMPEVAKTVAAMTDDQIQAVESGGSFRFEEFELGIDDIQVRRSERPGLALRSDGFMTVALDTELTPELEAEGLAREIVHHIQNVRKRSGFEIADRIALEVEAHSPSLEAAVLRHKDYICKETLALEFELKRAVTGTTLDANGHTFTLAVRRANRTTNKTEV